MIDFSYFLNWFKHKKLNKSRIKAQKMLLTLNALTVTIHGRLMLTKVCNDPDNGLPDEIRRMYWILLKDAPIRQYSQWN